MKLLSLNLMFLCFVFTTFPAQAQSNVYTNADHVALNGYDVVAYHSVHTAVRGSQAHSAVHHGTHYYFESAANQAKFSESPETYLPVYGGYCAFAMAMKGAQVPTDPRTFKLRDGKLYLFFNDYYEGTPFNTIVPWNGNEAEMVDKANENWKKL